MSSLFRVHLQQPIYECHNIPFVKHTLPQPTFPKDSILSSNRRIALGPVNKKHFYKLGRSHYQAIEEHLHKVVKTITQDSYVLALHRYQAAVDNRRCDVI